ncbi:MAG TPA: hypothetical protein VNV87_06065 [Acidimicrobiales bacterium]|jgi:hypothetical protein|nr:hypothetical protein [Acidimicrobiales bacterium]
MPSDSTGKWVARAASTGGGRTYRGQAPINWYASLAVIVIVGLLLVGFSRYQRSHPNSSSAGAPTTSDTWHVALGIDICGTMQPNLPTDTSATSGFTTDGTGVITVAPKNKSESGGNAVLGKFVSEYKGLALSSTTFQYPGKALMSNGDKCPKGTPQAGQQGFVTVKTWPNFESKLGTVASGDPTQVKFSNAQMITIAFVSADANVPKPPASTITSLITAASGPSTTTTAPSTATTAPTTSTTAPTSTTTPTSTTAPPATTTTPTTRAPTTTTAPTGKSGTTK